MDAFGTRGYDGTSLDDLARELGIRKQTILYWFPSKEALLEAVVDRCADEVTPPARARPRAGRRRLRAGGGDGAGHVPPGRPPPVDARVPPRGDPARPAGVDAGCSTTCRRSIDRASAFLEAEMDAGRMRRHDPRLLLLAAYSMVTGMATEVEVLRAFGEEPTLRVARPPPRRAAVAPARRARALTGRAAPGRLTYGGCAARLDVSAILYGPSMANALGSAYVRSHSGGDAGVGRNGGGRH